ncbi:hypothetical protein KP509_1Z067300 [Ceratopteris richardii]|nr:hypothetical protein KP509_1Z067300 [Ceratopteris richardii]
MPSAQADNFPADLEAVKLEINRIVRAHHEENLALANHELDSLEKKISMLTSQMEDLSGGYKEALRENTKMQDKLNSTLRKEADLVEILESERRKFADTNAFLSKLEDEFQRLSDEKSAIINEASAREKYFSDSMLSMEQRMHEENSDKIRALMHLIDEQSANHTAEMTALQEEFIARQCEAASEISLTKEQLKKCTDEIQSLNTQLDNDKMNHKTEMTDLKEHYQRRIDESLCETNASIDALKRQLTEEHQAELDMYIERVSLLTLELESLSKERKELLRQNEGLHKDLSSLKESKVEANEQLSRVSMTLSETQDLVQNLVRKNSQLSDSKEEEIICLKSELSGYRDIKGTLQLEKESLASENMSLKLEISSLTERVMKLSSRSHDEQKKFTEEIQRLMTDRKKLENALSDLEIGQNELLRQLNAEKMSGAASQERIDSLEDSQKDLKKENTELRCSFKEQLSSKEKEVSGLQDELQRVHDLNSRLHEQITYSRLEKDNAIVENQRMMATLMAMEDETKEMNLVNKSLKEDLENEKARNQAAMTSLRREIDCMQEVNDRLANESMLAKDKADSSSRVNEQLSRDILSLQSQKTQLQSELLQLRESLETSKAAEAKQQVEMEKLLDEIAKLSSENSNVANSVKLLEDQGKLLSSEYVKKDEQLAFLHRLSSDLEISHSALQSEIAKQKSDFEALESNNAVLQSSIEAKAKAIITLERQLEDFARRVSELETQIEIMVTAHRGVLDAEQKERASLEILVDMKDREIQKLREDLDKVSTNASSLKSQLEASRERESELESSLSAVKEELVKAKGEILNAEEEPHAAARFEGELNDASKRASLLEAQLSSKAAIQGELEFRVTSLQSDLQAALHASAQAEEEWKADMKAMRESANAQTKTLEEQLDSVQSALEEMRNNAKRGQERIATRQSEVSCLTEDKSSLEMMPSIQSNEADSNHEPKLMEEGTQQKRIVHDKSSFARIALRVFLVSAASSLMIAGIQAYMKNLEN